MPAATGMHWRRRGAACLRSATSARNPSNASPRLSARAPRSWQRCTPTWARQQVTPLWRPSRRRELKALELETRRDGTAAQRPVAKGLRRLPSVSRHDGLRPFAGGKIAAELEMLDATRVMGDFERKRCAGIPMPHLGGGDAMPVRAFAALEQKIDRGRCRVAKRLAEMAAFRMRLEIKEANHGIRGQILPAESRGQKRFLRSRISANTFQAGLPARLTDFATSGASARKNGLAAFSAPIVAGTVGLPTARSFATSSARAASALLFGSMVLAKRILASVYSWPQ